MPRDLDTGKVLVSSDQSLDGNYTTEEFDVQAPGAISLFWNATFGGQTHFDIKVEARPLDPSVDETWRPVLVGTQDGTTPAQFNTAQQYSRILAADNQACLAFLTTGGQKVRLVLEPSGAGITLNKLGYWIGKQ